ncbi:MAG: DUF86 domain-containing protein [Cyclobacteriaceae bacterium]|nr:DUF86 domain-containing protein [Cyclobacteriaceae bacterium]
MKPSDRDYLLYLEDIAQAIDRIQEYIAESDFQKFKWDYKTVDAVVRNFEIIGEASKNLPLTIKGKYPEIPWDEMYRLRNRVSHEYFGIDYEILWDIITRHLPQNRKDIAAILEREKPQK